MSEKISTRGVQVTGTKLHKELKPGNQTVRINSISFDKTPFKEESWNINLHLEGEPMGADFEGFLIDKDNESKGRYKGQCSRVRASTYPFKDGMAGSIQLIRDVEILKWMKQFTDALGISKWFEDQSDKHDTIEDLLDQLETDKPYEGLWLSSCLAGKTYIQEAKDGSGNTYVKYDLYLPYFNAKSVPLEIKGTEPSKLIKFNEEVHIFKSKAKEKKSSAEFEL